MKNKFKGMAEVRWSNYRQHLITELSKLVTKDRLTFYQEYAKNDKSGRLLREALMFHRNEKRNGNL